MNESEQVFFGNMTENCQILMVNSSAFIVDTQLFYSVFTPQQYAMNGSFVVDAALD
jgi:hypothetical protein